MEIEESKVPSLPPQTMNLLLISSCPTANMTFYIVNKCLFNPIVKKYIFQVTLTILKSHSDQSSHTRSHIPLFQFDLH